MPKKDLSQKALGIVKIATGEKEKPIKKEKDPNAVALGRKGGLAKAAKNPSGKK